ncbi:MAG TPA: malto-oligosyltrehalose synthase [Opitutaceae bacterium]|jgi:(1->4)-alpha-D-glucan 1-alpha-D-glucosylmutase|nr:malto-oligosyltrehalose synthase [Opitutaceae bacterium]
MPLRESAHVPVCTYRVQLHGRFTFGDLNGLLPYFRALGISDFYLSPIFTATPGSLHGYDVTDYGKINPELGGSDGFDLLAKRLRGEGCDILLDFVPNHMGIAGMLNHWWRDVLESGRLSPYASFFDIQWREEITRDHPRVLVPVLEDHYGKILEQGKIILAYGNEFSLRYGEVDLPVSPDSYVKVLEPLSVADGDDEGPRLVAAVIAGFTALPKPAAGLDQETARKRAEMVDSLKKNLAGVMADHPQIRDRLSARLQKINGVPGEASSFDELHALIEKQHYRLSRWKTGAHEINYRRFFAIDSLVGLHMEKTDVFRECHELLGRLVREGKVAGLRIDHIDGLRQPEDYLRRLQSLERPDASKPLYVMVEKILARGELLPDGWPVQGTTGYEFIPQLAALFVKTAAESRFDEIYRRFTGETGSYREIVYEKKRLIIGEMFVNAVSNLGAELVEIVAVDRRWRDLTRHELTTAVSELMANLPVYRTYRRRQQPVSAQDRQVLEEACARALVLNPRADPQPFEFVRDLLIGSYPGAGASEDYRSSLLSWVLTFQQYTGAVMAKAVEDTAYYTYNRLIPLNEVGGDPESFGGSVDGFHRANLNRLAMSPHAMLTTSTHDTKLSEDVRARLYVLSELADEWESWLREWYGLTARHTTLIDGCTAPDALDLYRFYQILLGVWPLEAAEVDAAFRARLREHFRKAVNEAKRHTSILQANDAYLEACDRFVDRVTAPESAQDFLAAFLPCAQRVARLGMVNSLAQLILKCTVPGMPDFYQGNEIWDFSLVDPDNRREVDYRRRQQLLEASAGITAAKLLENWRDGGIKLRVMQGLLQFRAQHPRLFSQGDYCPIAGQGGFGDQLVAFARREGDMSMLVVVPRLAAKHGSPPLGLTWDDTRLELVDGANGWRDLFTERVFPAGEPLFLRELFDQLPFAVLQGIGRGGA